MNEKSKNRARRGRSATSKGRAWRKRSSNRKKKVGKNYDKFSQL